MTSYRLLLAIVCAVRCAAASEVNYVALTPPVSMPNGSSFLTWGDETKYARSYHVDQAHPRAADQNPGTAELPFRTINRAAQVVKPGERVWIHGGVYREMVQPRLSGEGPDRMIAYEAVPGEQVTLKGSRVVETRWERSRRLRGPSAPVGYSRKLWMTTLPESFFEGGYNPFATPNATNEEMDLMPWATSWKGRLPYTLARGLLFQEGRRLQQLAAYEDLVRLPGSYWVGPDGRTVHIHALGSGDPNGKFFEAAVQPHLFKPQGSGFGFLRVSGLTLEHCANSFLRTGIGALFTMGGHHWIIERNTVRHINSVGIEIGFEIYEDTDKRYTRRTDANLGHTIVRGNRIYDCGTAGIRGLVNNYALVESNVITDCGWQDAEYHWETAGIKLLLNTGTLVRNNDISRIEAGGGIWLDWDNKNSRVTGNVLRDISTVQGAVFVEASQEPNMVDNNVFWNIDGQGVRVADTDNLTVAHNLFGRVKEDLIVARVATERDLGGRRLTSNNNRVVNNIFVDAEKPINFGDASNTADYNVYLATTDTAGVKPLAGETHSVVIKGDVQVNGEELLLTWMPGQALPSVPAVKGCDRDFAGAERDGEASVAGPFVGLSRTATFLLKR
jgi:alpha-N-arabinofuranosidase